MPYSKEIGAWRRIGGKEYRLYRMVSSKVKAQKLKGTLMQTGYYVRVMKYRGEYAVLVR